MVIEINKDIDRYQESVAMGLTARQLVYSVTSVAAGGSLVLLLYRYIGLTGAAYVAIPCVAPIALGGFYSYNGMNFYEYMGRKIHFMFSNRTLTYISTEGEAALRELEAGAGGTGKKNGKEKTRTAERPEAKNAGKEEFEEVKRRTKRIVCGVLAALAVAVIGAVIYKVAG